jgi:hypothetical protein
MGERVLQNVSASNQSTSDFTVGRSERGVSAAAPSPADQSFRKGIPIKTGAALPRNR